MGNRLLIKRRDMPAGYSPPARLVHGEVAATAVRHAKASGCIWAKHPAMTAADALVQDDAATTSLIAALQAARPDRVVLRDNDRGRAIYPSQSSRL